MKVRELIEALGEFPPEREVVLDGEKGRVEVLIERHLYVTDDKATFTAPRDGHGLAIQTVVVPKCESRQGRVAASAMPDGQGTR